MDICTWEAFDIEIAQVQLHLAQEASVKTQKDGVQGASG